MGASACVGCGLAFEPVVVVSAFSTLSVLHPRDSRVALLAGCGVLAGQAISQVGATELTEASFAQSIARFALQAFALVATGTA